MRLFLFLAVIGLIACNFALCLLNFEREETSITLEINKPVGIAFGDYKLRSGYFFTSYKTNSVYFVTKNENCSNGESNCHAISHVAGSTIRGSTDGNFESASFSYPSRICYMKSQNALFVNDRGTGYIRILNLLDGKVNTLRSGYAQGPKFRLNSNNLDDTHPEVDIKQFNHYLYVSDGKYVYNITNKNGFESLSEAISVTRYNVLTQWELANDYNTNKHKIYITSIAIQENTQNLFVSYSFQRNAIIYFPIHLKDVSDIRVLISDGVLWDQIPLYTPVSVDGYLNLNHEQTNVPATVAFPIHMTMKDNTLLWIEAFSYSSFGPARGVLGSLAVRRLDMATMYVGCLYGCMKMNGGNMNQIGANVHASDRSTHISSNADDDSNDVDGELAYPISLSQDQYSNQVAILDYLMQSITILTPSSVGGEDTFSSSVTMSESKQTNEAEGQSTSASDSDASTDINTSQNQNDVVFGGGQAMTPVPTGAPTSLPSGTPTAPPSGMPSSPPTSRPSSHHTGTPTLLPSPGPSSAPTSAPTNSTVNAKGEGSSQERCLRWVI